MNMRPALKVYVVLVSGTAGALLVTDLLALSSWMHPWSYALVAGLAIVSGGASRIQFLLHRGWYTGASTPIHIAAAFLLPPGLAEVVAAAGALTRGITLRHSAVRNVFNVSSISIAVNLAAHVTSAAGGPPVLSDVNGWPGLPIAIVASTIYHVVSASTVAGVVAIDQRRPFWQILRPRVGLAAVVEIGLGLVGATVAVVLIAMPGWTPALILPATLVYFAKQAMDNAERRSRNLTLTSAIGRAVAGTLDPEAAFQAITARNVRDLMRVDGLALAPLQEPYPFNEYVASDLDQPLVREELARHLAADPRVTQIRGDGKSAPEWLPQPIRDLHVAAAALPFGAGSERAVGALIAWRGSRQSRELAFNQEELLVLETLADYAAVALETARLAREMARMSREAAETEAMREVEALREVSRLKDEFLGQVSHELRTPLTIIHGYAELVADGLVSDTDEVAGTAREIHTNSALMLRLVDDLLDTSRLESGHLSLKLETLDIGSWVERTANAFAQGAPAHVVEAEVIGTLPQVLVDSARLGQVMNNLLTNAARYSPEGSRILVKARGSRSGDEVEIRVVDEGVGIASDECTRIFEKFYRGKDGPTLAVRGTGLGLAVAKSLVEAHHGRIGVESTLGKGSSFWITLPTAWPSADVAADGHAGTLREPPPSADFKRPAQRVVAA